MTFIDLLRDVTIVAAVIGGLIALVREGFAIWSNKRKTQSEADLNTSQTAGEIVDTVKELMFIQREGFDKKVSELEAKITAMQIDEKIKENHFLAEIDALKEDNNALKADNNALKDYLGKVVATLRENNIEPPPRPDILKDTGKFRAIK